MEPAPRGRVRAMFDRIAAPYDRANTVLSVGLHHGWRRMAARATRLRPGQHAVDVACGTGALAALLGRKVGPGGTVVGVDLSEGMVQVGRRRLRAVTNIRLVLGDALNLPLADGSVDAATIAFGIRNVPDADACLAEMARVVRPGGRVVVLEFGQPAGPIGPAFRFYSGKVLPRVGGWITGDRAAYEYLHRTSSRFPSGAAFVERMARTGLAEVEDRPLAAGVAHVYSATVTG